MSRFEIQHNPNKRFKKWRVVERRGLLIYFEFFWSREKAEKYIEKESRSTAWKSV